MNINNISPVWKGGNLFSNFPTTWMCTLHKKVKDIICQYLDLNTKIKANSWNNTLNIYKISKYPKYP